MKKYLLILALFCCSYTFALSFFEINSQTKQKMLLEPRTKNILNLANVYLKAKPIDVKPTLKIEKNRYYGLFPKNIGFKLTGWMEALGYSYLLTNDEKYAQKGVELLMATVKDFPVNHPRIEKSFHGETGQILYGIAIGTIFFDKYLSLEDKLLIKNRTSDYIDMLISKFSDPNYWCYEVHNHYGVAFGPAGIICLIFDDNVRLQHCVKLLKFWLNKGFDSKGLPAEGSPYYRYSALRVMLFALMLKENGGEDLFTTTRIGLWPRAYLAKQIPGSNFMDTRNDGYIDTPGLECLYVAIAKQDPIAAWLWENYVDHEKYFPLTYFLKKYSYPEGKIDFSKYKKAEFFPQRHFATWRTGWSKDDVMFSIEAGPFIKSEKGRGITHGQSDKGHFCLYAFGEMWGIDSGYANDSGVNPKTSRSHTFAHSCVLVDNKGQAIAGQGRGVSAKIVKFLDNEKIGYAKANCTRAYKRNNKYQTGIRIKHAIRETLFVRPSNNVPAYAVVLDNIEKDKREHIYTWQMMIPNNKNVLLRKNGAVIANNMQYNSYLTTLANAKPGAASWEIDIPTKCKKSVWGLFKAGSGNILAEDSFYLVLDKQKPFRWDFNANLEFAWQRIWENGKTKMFDFSQGTNTISLKTREHKANAQALFIGDDINANPISKKGKFLYAKDAKISGGMTREFVKVSKNKVAVYLSSTDDDIKMRLDTYLPPNKTPPSLILQLRGEVKCINPYFAAVLVPLKNDVSEPKINFDRSQKNIVKITLEWPTAIDTVMWQIKLGKIDFDRKEKGN